MYIFFCKQNLIVINSWVCFNAYYLMRIVTNWIQVRNLAVKNLHLIMDFWKIYFHPLRENVLNKPPSVWVRVCTCNGVHAVHYATVSDERGSGAHGFADERGHGTTFAQQRLHGPSPVGPDGP